LKEIFVAGRTEEKRLGNGGITVSTQCKYVRGDVEVGEGLYFSIRFVHLQSKKK
jgi:hypothetical protein